MSTAHRRLLPESFQIPNLRNPLDSVPSEYARGVHKTRGELPGCPRLRTFSDHHYWTTVTCQSSGRPGTGVHGVGLHTSGPATNGTSTVAVPAPVARSVPVKVLPEAWLDSRANTRGSETVGGPGQVPPDMASPPVSTSAEPTVTQTAVTP